MDVSFERLAADVRGMAFAAGRAALDASDAASASKAVHVATGGQAGAATSFSESALGLTHAGLAHIGFVAANATYDSPSYFLWNGERCAKTSPITLIDSTRYLTRCAVSSIGAIMALSLLLPTLLLLHSLRSREQGEKTPRGQLAAFFALLAPFLSLLNTVLHSQRNVNGLGMPIPDLVILLFSALTAFAQSAQDGRVRVCATEVVFSWVMGGFVYASWLLIAVLRGDAWFLPLLSALAAGATIFCEAANPARAATARYSFSDISVLNRGVVGYAAHVLKKSRTDQLENEDIPEPGEYMDSLELGLNFQASRAKLHDMYENPKKYGWTARVLLFVFHPFVSSARARMFWSLLWVDVFGLLRGEAWALVNRVLQLLQPTILAWWLASLQAYRTGTQPLYVAYYVGLLLGAAPGLAGFISVLEHNELNAFDGRVRAAAFTAVYRKSLDLSPAAREQFDTSRIMNLVSVDSEQVFSMLETISQLLMVSILFFSSIGQLWTMLGPALLGGIAIYVVLLPVQLLLGASLGRLFPKLMARLDERSKLTTNALRSIKSLKLHAWENPFFERIKEVRLKELEALHSFWVRWSYMNTSYNSASDFVAIACFAMFLILRRGALTPEIVFPTLLLLQIAQLGYLLLPTSVTMLLQGLVSCGRMEEFFAAEADERPNYDVLPPALSFDEPAVIVKDARVSWNGEDADGKIALDGVSVEARAGDLLCVIGRVGAGKTAVLKTICGETVVLSGSVSVKGKVAYSPQEAWLQNRTLRENVLFGLELDEPWYKSVIAACALEADIEQMEDGDATNVGERGISLSGGQKARVALARAVYSRADVIVLDDVLSAVDEHVGAHLISKVFSAHGLLGNRTVVLGTNNIKVLSHASRIVAIENRRIAQTASFAEMRAHPESTIYKIVEEFGDIGDVEQESVDRRELVKANLASYAPRLAEKPLEYEFVDVTKDNREEEEEKVVGSFKPLLRYFFMDRPWYTWVTIVTIVISALFRNYLIMWVGVLASKGFDNFGAGKMFVYVYVFLAVSNGSLLYLSSYMGDTTITLRTALMLHDQMLQNVLRAPMQFFDRTPLGRLINRFTGDLKLIDNGFSMYGAMMLRALLNTGMMLVGMLMGAPPVLIAAVPVMFWANRCRLTYVPAQRKVTRIYSAANSPILSHIEDTMKGQAVVRAFGASAQFRDVFERRTNYWLKVDYFRRNLGSWLEVRIKLLGAVLGVSTALALTQIVGLGFTGASYAGVILNFCDRVGMFVGQSIASLATLETRGVSLERIFEFIDMPQEAAGEIEATRPAPGWPQRGEITFDNYSTRYTPDGPLVLKNLTFKINAGEKVGIVGRTGSGKSTLTMAVFRIIEASGGRVEMDRINTSILGLHDLRSRLSIVPQDSQIFDASVRANLDPFTTKTDAELWEILELCHLKAHFERFEGLDTELSDASSALSRGQAQLLNLGRALVHKSRILVLDEATASVDHETDKILQETIRKTMADRTVLTVAHRLNTIMDSDRILVLDKGEVKEFDTPERLIEMKGIFWSLVNAEKAQEEADAREAAIP